MIEKLEKMLAAGKDSPMLRFGLGNAYLSAGNPESAIFHLTACINQDKNYSAAWKLLGHAYRSANNLAAARKTYKDGIKVAEASGDIQAAKEMQVFLRKLNKT